jgi:LmbE family N-acetylglucosaminyl deacetylase
MDLQPLRLLIVGAHPDDADYHAGGLAALYRRAGHFVKMVSLTNGAAGHHLHWGPELTRRRRAEAAASAAVIGAAYEVYENGDGALLPTLEARSQVIRLIRSFKPNLVLTHRPHDYHPDHRATSMLVQDAAYLITVPAIVPDTPHLTYDPVIAFFPDAFEKPYPFQPSVAVDVSSVQDEMVAMLHCHRSQFYEWLPSNRGQAEQVPMSDEDRREWLALQIRARLRALAERHRPLVLETFGERGPSIEFIEAFETCEYGAQLNEATKKALFTFN